MTELVALLLGVVLIGEFVLERLPGLFPPAPPGGAVAAVTVIAPALGLPVAWLGSHDLLAYFGLEQAHLVLWVLVAALAVRSVIIAAARLRPPWSPVLAEQRARLAFDVTGAGAAALAALAPASLAAAFTAGLIAGVLGAVLRLLLADLRRRLDGGDVPRRWRGAAIALVSAAIVSLASAGLAGLWPG